MGMGFLMGVNIFHGYEFGIAKPGGFVPVASLVLIWHSNGLETTPSDAGHLHSCTRRCRLKVNTVWSEKREFSDD
jgi:hypothetical protein